jgi:hypothetical protein
MGIVGKNKKKYANIRFFNAYKFGNSCLGNSSKLRKKFYPPIFLQVGNKVNNLLIFRNPLFNVL